MVSMQNLTRFQRIESEILEKGDEMTSKEARVLHRILITYYNDFLTSLDFFNAAVLDVVERKFISLELKLLRFFSLAGSTLVPETITKSKVNEQSTDTRYLTSLHREQKFYIQMIESLESTDNVNPKGAEIQLKHLNQFYEKFIANQCKIVTLVEETSFDGEVEISTLFQQKIIKIQEKLQNIISPPAETTPTVSESNSSGHLNGTKQPYVIADSLESRFKKQKSLIEQIEWIESKVNPGPAEAEALHNYLLLVNDLFVNNQTSIENYNGFTSDEHLKISSEICKKVIYLQKKLKRIFAPIALTSNVSNDTAYVKVNLMRTISNSDSDDDLEFGLFD